MSHPLSEVLSGARSWHIETGDCLEVLRAMPSNSVHVCATSPPYFALRSYLPADHPDKTKEIGLERSLAEYVAKMVEVFREVRRVLHPTGVAFVNLGDSYAANPGNGRGGESVEGGAPHRTGRDKTGAGVKPKDLLMVPARVAIALCDDGWFLRSDIVWAKTACMPESVTDRPTSAHEHIFLLAKRSSYYYDAEAVREPSVELERPQSEKRREMRLNRGIAGVGGLGQSSKGIDAGLEPSHVMQTNPAGRNLRNVWSLAPEPLTDDHFAAWPTEIPRRAILAGSSERGVCPACGNPWRRVSERSLVNVIERRESRGIPGREGKRCNRTRAGDSLTVTTGWEPTCTHNLEPIPALAMDPFSGSGRTGIVARRLGRRYVGIELSEYQAAKSRQRIVSDQGIDPQHAGEVQGNAQLRLLA